MGWFYPSGNRGHGRDHLYPNGCCRLFSRAGEEPGSAYVHTRLLSDVYAAHSAGQPYSVSTCKENHEERSGKGRFRDFASV